MMNSNKIKKSLKLDASQKRNKQNSKNLSKIFHVTQNYLIISMALNIH